MKKSFPFLANSILFILGICGIVLNLPYLAAVSILAISLIFIWYYGMAIGLFGDNDDKEDENELEERNLKLSKSVKVLNDINSQLEAEVDSLKKEIKRLNDEKNYTVSPQNKTFYNCPLTSAVPIKINDLLERYINNGSVKFEKAQISVEYTCQNNNAQTYLSESALMIICNNIFDNILKFAPQNTRIYVRVTKRDDDNLLIFKNSGNGITENETQKICDFNFKGSNSKYGNGLGLSQVKEIMDDFGGSVWSKSAIDNGFALYLQIPKNVKQRQAKEEDYE